MGWRARIGLTAPDQPWVEEKFPEVGRRERDKKEKRNKKALQQSEAVHYELTPKPPLPGRPWPGRGRFSLPSGRAMPLGPEHGPGPASPVSNEFGSPMELPWKEVAWARPEAGPASRGRAGAAADARCCGREPQCSADEERRLRR